MKKLLCGVSALCLVTAAQADQPLVFTFTDTISGGSGYTAFQIMSKTLFNGGQYTITQLCSNAGMPGTSAWQIMSLMTNTLEAGGNLTSILRYFVVSGQPANYTPDDYTGTGKILVDIPCAADPADGLTTPLSIASEPSALFLTANADYAAFKTLSQKLGGTTIVSLGCLFDNNTDSPLPIWKAYTIRGERYPVIIQMSVTNPIGIPQGTALAMQPFSFEDDFPNAKIMEGCFSIG